VNRYVTGSSRDVDAVTALGDFQRFPAWMWRNQDVVAFVEWMRARNEGQAQPATKARFYGLDLYSLRASMEAVIDYLDRVEPAEAQRAPQRYGCFDHVNADGQAYGFALAFEQALLCQNEVVAQLLELRRRSEAYLRSDGWVAADDWFYAEQNALLVRDAEEYYQADVSGGRVVVEPPRPSYGQHPRRADRASGPSVRPHEGGGVGAQLSRRHARATMMGMRGEFNVGQLARQRYGSKCFLIGFTTYDGRVTSASNWGEPRQRRRVRPALAESYESLLHAVAIPSFWVSTADHAVRNVLQTPRLERAIGVIYRPETERSSHYFSANLADQFDAVIHIDRTRALEPLERMALWGQGEPPETFPTGL